MLNNRGLPSIPSIPSMANLRESVQTTTNDNKHATPQHRSSLAHPPSCIGFYTGTKDTVSTSYVGPLPGTKPSDLPIARSTDLSM
ncbi:hypothetical protein J8273_5892 [Carpediemonas membranifera]|uniref:Uncharacterized protein n=1 Tax=Carpediemonas membranifera TaxID=201153 RepID=A0A8J6E0X4_9EUKA|nr:hypothetical protein J8273_5892 [Carpediemonas membranifera]|eukprot:KAG9392753.1 hypothetical protein J8273_5892 [Carpediemonas membranifera]